jgi:hypothetical protein
MSSKTKVRVRVLWPTAFEVRGIDVPAGDELEMDKAEAEAFIAEGAAEAVQPAKK